MGAPNSILGSHPADLVHFNLSQGVQYLLDDKTVMGRRERIARNSFHPFQEALCETDQHELKATDPQIYRNRAHREFAKSDVANHQLGPFSGLKSHVAMPLTAFS